MTGTNLSPDATGLLIQTIGELKDAVRDLASEVSNTYVRKDVLDPQLAEIRRDVKGHDDWLMWAQRIVIGAVIVALLAVVVTQGGATP